MFVRYPPRGCNLTFNITFGFPIVSDLKLSLFSSVAIQHVFYVDDKWDDGSFSLFLFLPRIIATGSIMLIGSTANDCIEWRNQLKSVEILKVSLKL